MHRNVMKIDTTLTLPAQNTTPMSPQIQCPYYVAFSHHNRGRHVILVHSCMVEPFLVHVCGTRTVVGGEVPQGQTWRQEAFVRRAPAELTAREEARLEGGREGKA